MYRTVKTIFRLISKLRMALLLSIVSFLCMINSASAETWSIKWTAGEIVQALQEAQASGQPFDKLAKKVHDELAKAGFQVIDGSLTYSTIIPARRTTFADLANESLEESRRMLWDYLLSAAIAGPNVGYCSSLIPDGALMAVRSEDADIIAKFDNGGTYINLTSRTTPTQVVLSLNVDADITAHAKFGFEWCGTVVWPPTDYTCATPLVRNPACPPPYWGCDSCYGLPCHCGTKYPPCGLPDVCPVPIPVLNNVEESWTDWTPAVVDGSIVGSVELVLDYSFNAADNVITVGTPKINPVHSSVLPSAVLGAVIPDMRLIPIPGAYVPHDVTSHIMQTFNGLVDSALLMAKASGDDDNYVNQHVWPELVKKQQVRLDALSSQYFPMTIELPVINDCNTAADSNELMKAVLDYLYNNFNVVGELAFDVVKNNWSQVLYYVVTDNRAALEQLLTSEALCSSLEQLKTTMPVSKLYSKAGGQCSEIDPRTPGPGPFYATSDCQTEIGFQAERFTDFCRELFASKPNSLLGNAAAWPTLNVETDALTALPDSKWTLSSAAQLGAGVEPINYNHIPFMKRVLYRQAGDCALEMRVYKKNISDTNLKPLLLIHGGSWAQRGAGFLGTESVVSHYTEDNFVVFAPFYRLAGNKDGNAECRNATWGDIVGDVDAALDWVIVNGAAVGAGDTSKIAVTGQSAGAHLAGWLMTHRPDQISRGLLFYPPTDVHDFMTRLQGVDGAAFPPLSNSAGTPYDPSSAEEIIENFLQLPSGSARTVDLNNPQPYITENSFAQKIGSGLAATPPAVYPPAFIVQGTRDALLTYSQSQVLCESYGGVVNVDWSATPALRAIYTCGDQGQLHLFKEADHAFEICPFPEIACACRAGSTASAVLLTDSLQRGRQWLLQNDALLNRKTLTAAKTGTGSGTITTATTAPAAINCGTDCTGEYPAGATVTLTATPSVNSLFTGWSGGGCSGIGPCVISMNSDVSVKATFKTATLTVIKTGTGSGTVMSSPAGISCGEDCSGRYVPGTSVTLTASPSAGSLFADWSGGGCSGTGPCVVRMNGDVSVTATFKQPTLTVAKTGSGTVASSPAGISCGSDCTEMYPVGTSVTLTAVPSADSWFAGWSGGCSSSTGSCVVAMNDDVSVTATFKQNAVVKLTELITRVGALEKSAFRQGQLKRAFINKLKAVKNDVEQGLYQDARQKLKHDLLPKINGCSRERHPDKNDWIVSCQAQSAITTDITEIIQVLPN